MDISAIGQSYMNQAKAGLNYDVKSAENFQNVLAAAQAKGDDAELKKACYEFESYFLQMMFKEMRKTVNYSEGFMNRGRGEEIFQDFLDEEYSKSAAKQGGFGLADFMYRQMKAQYAATVVNPPQ